MVQVQHLPIYHMPKAVASFHRAFTKDPVQNYLFEDEESTATSWRPVARKLLRGVRYSLLWVKYNVWGFTFGLDGGAAYTIGALAKNSVAKKDLFLRAALFAITILEYPLAVLNRLAIFIVFTPQQRQRAKEITSKMESTIARTLGDAAEDYIFLDTLCCAPEKQGRGYGGILVRSVTKIADEQRRKVWLLSSNIKNNKFYRSQGFEVVTEIIAGDSDPTYRGEPVVVEMMVYDPSK